MYLYVHISILNRPRYRVLSKNVAGWIQFLAIIWLVVLRTVSISRSIKTALHGLCFFDRNGQSHSVALELVDTNTKKALKSLTGTFSSVKLDYKNYSYFGFEVPLEAILLKKNKRYEIRALITGPSSQFGTNFINPVQCSGVTFIFFTSEDSGSRTDVRKGQFPILLFSL